MRQILYIFIAWCLFCTPCFSASLIGSGVITTTPEATIESLTVHAIIRSVGSDQGSAIYLNNIQCGVASQQGNLRGVTTTYTDYTYTFSTAPDGSSWTAALVNSTGIGVKTNISAEIRVTQLWAVVNWSDASTTTLRPNAVGCYTGWEIGGAESTYWESVDDTTSDGDTTYIYETTAYQNVVVNLEDLP